MTQGEDIAFDARGLTLRGKRWGRGNSRRILALHGWMDNCHSYLPLSDYLRDCDLVAIDLAGNGLSDHRSADSAYNIWQDIPELDEVLSGLGWRTATLMGHSRGAMVATLFAGTLRDSVERLILLDGFAPFPIPEEKAPEQLAMAIRDNKRFAGDRRRYYETREEALKSRMAGPLKLSREAAEYFAGRGLLESEEGCYWSGDRRLRSASEVKLSQRQIVAFINAIRSPIDIIVRTDWQALFEKNLRELPLTADIHLTAMQGSHHLHMDNATVATVAGEISRILEG